MQCKIPACRSTEHCPGGILSLRWQSQIPTEIDGLLSSLCGEPFSRERWLLSFWKHFWLAAWQRDKHKNTEKARAIDRQIPQPTHRSIGLFLHMHWLTDWQTRWKWRQTESWHMHITRTRLCWCSRAHICIPHNRAVWSHSLRIFLGAQEWHAPHVDSFLVIKFSTNSKWHCHPSRLPVSFAPPQKINYNSVLETRGRTHGIFMNAGRQTYL